MNLPIALGGGLLGFAMIGAAVWFLRKPQDSAKEELDGTDAYAGEDMLDEIINRIAALDQAHEEGRVPDDEYGRTRTRLREEAKGLLDESPHK